MAQPLNLLCFIAAMGLLARLKWPKAGQKIANTALVAILVLGILPIGPLLLNWMERQYPKPETLPPKVDGIILLGGAFETGLSQTYGHIAPTGQMGRVLCFVDIAREYPNAKLAFTGGSGNMAFPEARESIDAKEFFAMSILNKRKIIYEERSRNTYENAVFSKEIIKPKAGENWILVTSAFHMPRSVGIFEKQGWPVIPYACDQKTYGTLESYLRMPNINSNYALLGIVFKEWVGSIVYYVTGKTAFILPPAKVTSDPS